MKTKTTKLWLRSTSSYPKAECFILCRTALESVERSLNAEQELPRIIVKLTNSCHAYAGRGAWTFWEHHGPHSNRKATLWKRVLVRIGKPDRFPRKACYPTFKDMPEYEFRTYREGMVGVVAHETGHALGYSGRKSGEEHCELMAWDAVDYYRAHQARIDAEIDAALREQQDHAARLMAAQAPSAKTAKKLAAAVARLKRWKRKQALAETKVKVYTRLLRRLSKVAVLPEPLPLAATTAP